MNGPLSINIYFIVTGKGVTFDTGGISLKPSKGMEAMRADMGGAACTLGALYGIAAMKLPLFVRGESFSNFY